MLEGSSYKSALVGISVAIRSTNGVIVERTDPRIAFSLGWKKQKSPEVTGARSSVSNKVVSAIDQH